MAMPLAAKTTPSPSDAKVSQPHRWLWTRERYYLAGESGVFQPDERVELLDGEVFTMSPVGSRHSAAVYKASRNLEALFGSEYIVRTEAPVILTDLSEPQPDLCVVPRRADFYSGSHPVPANIQLIVEMSESTLAYDRGQKALAYAAAGIREYWILDLLEERLEVYRNPDAAIGYRVFELLTSTESVAPLFAPERRVPVIDLIPEFTNE